MSTPCLKNVLHLACYYFDRCDRIFTLVGRNVADKVGNWKTFYCAISSNLCFCATRQNWESRKFHFFTQMLYQLHCQDQDLTSWLITTNFWLTTHIHAAVWLPQSCNQCVQFGAVGGMVQEKGSRERCRSWTVCCTHNVPVPSALSFGFPISQGNAEALGRWGGKTKHRLISYVVSNISVKHYRNRIVCVKIIASQRWHFLRHSISTYSIYYVYGPGYE